MHHRPGRPFGELAPPPALPAELVEGQGIDDALIQPSSGHEYRRSLAVYSRLSLADAQQRHDEVIDRDPV
jgi:hypothetical protein